MVAGRDLLVSPILPEMRSLRFPTSRVTGFDIVGSTNTGFASLSIGPISLPGPLESSGVPS